MNPDPAVPGWLLSAGLVAGCFFCLLSAIGCLRAKDTYARIHVATKAVAFGGAILVICQMLANPDPTVLVFGVVTLAVVFIAGARPRHFAVLLLLGIVATCRAIGVPVQAYLAWAFERLGTHRDVFGLDVAEMTPAAFKRSTL